MGLFFSKNFFAPNENGNTNDKTNADVQAIGLDGRAEKVRRNDLCKGVAYARKQSVPDGTTKSGVDDKRNDGHASQARRNRNQLATNWQQTAYESSSFATLKEVVFGLLEFVVVEHKQFAPSAIDKTVDEFATKEARQVIIDERTYERAECGAKNDDKEIELTGGSIVGSRRDYEFGRQGHNRVFENHENGEHQITKAIGVPLNKRCYECCDCCHE